MSTPLPDLTIPQNVGFDTADTSPIIHSIKWRHVPDVVEFSSVGEVITYHDTGVLKIDIQNHKASYLDIYFLRNSTTTNMSVTTRLRYVSPTTSLTVIEPITKGEKGKQLTLTNMDENSTLLHMGSLVFTHIDLKDGSPAYDFTTMANEGVYEVWVACETEDGKELNIRIPFEFSNFDKRDEKPTDPDEDDHPKEATERKAQDEYVVKIVEGDSPLTKVPSTHFRMAAVALLKKKYCFERMPIEVKKFETTPPPPPPPPPPPCGLKANIEDDSPSIEDIVKVVLTHSNTIGIVSETYTTDSESLDDKGNGYFKCISEGTASIHVVVSYIDGQQCETDIAFDIAGRTARCGEIVKSSKSGYDSTTYGTNIKGTYTINYDFYDTDDVMNVYAGTKLLHTTGIKKNKEGSPFTFDYDPKDGKLKVVMNEEGEGFGWEYSLTCPETPLSKEDVVKNTIGGHVIWYFDATGSMGTTIEKVKNSVIDLANFVEDMYKDVGKTVGTTIVFYGDRSDPVAYNVVREKANASDVGMAMESIPIYGGGDIPESGLYAIQQTLPSMISKDELNMVILATDAPTKTTEDLVTVAEIHKLFNDNSVKSFGIVDKNNEKPEVLSLFNSTVDYSESDYKINEWVHSLFK